MLIRNRVEEHVQEAYQSLKTHFPDFCACDTCHADVLVYVLNRLPARYVASQQGTVITELKLEQDQTRANIEVLVMEAFRKVTKSPRCTKRAGKQ